MEMNKNLGVETPVGKFEELQLTAKIKEALGSVYREYSKGGDEGQFCDGDPEKVEKIISDAGIDINGLIVKIERGKDIICSNDGGGYTVADRIIKVYKGAEDENALVFEGNFMDVDPNVEW
ncbi:MAG: hypothetical protein NTX66_00435 [Candidatus Falkowbacteria bacterium]|nr:hypothetical protein [Candidatus Falkowbacteria bacterium]